MLPKRAIKRRFRNLFPQEKSQNENRASKYRQMLRIHTDSVIKHWLHMLFTQTESTQILFVSPSVKHLSLHWLTHILKCLLDIIKYSYQVKLQLWSNRTVPKDKMILTASVAAPLYSEPCLDDFIGYRRPTSLARFDTLLSDTGSHVTTEVETFSTGITPVPSLHVTFCVISIGSPSCFKTERFPVLWCIVGTHLYN